MAKFWEKLGEEVTTQWVVRALVPALAFWVGGLLAWVSRYGWDDLLRWWMTRSPEEQAALSLGALLLAAFTATIMERLQGWIIQKVEGYWPWPLRKLRFALSRVAVRRMNRKERRWEALAGKANGKPETLAPEEQAEYAQLDGELAHFPADPLQAMPTAVGNILRSMEEYPQVRYGLTASVCWPRLWLLLPEEAREEVTAARSQLNDAARLFGLGVLFTVWTVWAWWALPVGLFAAWLAHRGMRLAALVYGDVVRSAFDLYRFALYEQLRWAIPAGSEEVQQGRRLSEYLFRGCDLTVISSEPAKE